MTQPYSGHAVSSTTSEPQPGHSVANITTQPYILCAWPTSTLHCVQQKQNEILRR